MEFRFHSVNLTGECVLYIFISMQRDPYTCTSWKKYTALTADELLSLLSVQCCPDTIYHLQHRVWSLQKHTKLCKNINASNLTDKVFPDAAPHLSHLIKYSAFCGHYFRGQPLIIWGEAQWKFSRAIFFFSETLRLEIILAQKKEEKIVPRISEMFFHKSIHHDPTDD